ncbi:MAG TPA: hypothetical protein PKL82_04745 [Anaerolineaceae bacterium]|jgi:hypothetical protein|nr:hypothetical protein [Anaerolineaceae bacterium]NMD26825.1 hypothetical protein [Chloroflexota bacterium]HOA21780.1 hypothetical protein [Anaerolineaceae bacterium]HOG77521.1 hypothetical protein [Anaerolineaceae bacterium]
MAYFIHIFTPLLKPFVYLDPGSGSMLIQLILAAVLSIGVAIRIFWKKIRAFLTRNKAADSQELDPTEIPEEPSAEDSLRS